MCVCILSSCACHDLLKYLTEIDGIDMVLIFQVPQTELSVLKHNQQRVHELSSLLMRSHVLPIAKAGSHQGTKSADQQARLDLMHRLEVSSHQSPFQVKRR